MRVVWTRTALRGIWRAQDYIAEFNPKAARAMAQALLEAGDRLATFPHRGRLVRGTGLREVASVSPFIIRYRVSGDELVILRVRHAPGGPRHRRELSRHLA